MNFKILQLRNTKIYNFSEDKNPENRIKNYFVLFNFILNRL